MSMLGNVLNNIISRPATRQYPFTKRASYEGARGHIEFDISNCAFCGACQRKCPAAAIVVNRPEKSLTFEPFRCIICEACVESCPKKSIQTVKEYRAPSATKPVEVYTIPNKPSQAPDVECES